MLYKVSNSPPQASGAVVRPPGKRLPEELLRDDRPGAGAESRPRMGARADVVQARDRRRMAGQLRPRTPHEVLVERAGAAVDVAADEVHVGRLQVRRREDDPLDEPRVEVLDVAGEPLFDAVGVAFSKPLRPGAVAPVELPGPLPP